MYRLSKLKSFTPNYDERRTSLDNDDTPSSPTSSVSSIDEEEVNRRIRPYWPKYRGFIKSRGFRLDTVRDVKLFYRNNQQTASTSNSWVSSSNSGNNQSQDDNALCPDAGLVSFLMNSSVLSLV